MPRPSAPRLVPRALPVLVAGAGPAGLVAAITLARHGIEVVLVERRWSPSLPRATAVSTRAMELFRAWGLEPAIRTRAVDVEFLMWESESLATAAAGSARSAVMPTREQAEMLSPTGPACIAQDELEPVLLRHLRSLPTARVHLGTEVVAVDPRHDGVRVTLRDATGERVVEAGHVIAADGAHSAIRRALGIPMQGPDDLVEAIAVVFRAPLWDLVGDLRYVLYAPEAGIVIPTGRGDRWMYGHLLEPGERLADFTEEVLAELVRTAVGAAGVQPRIEHVSRFSFAAQVAERFRAGRVLLVGDAAHRVTPRGGTGMNTAIQDGHDVGWKLAWALRGWAGPELIDTYEAERKPVAEHNVARSADASGEQWEPLQQLHVDLGGRIPHAWIRGGTRRSTLDLVGTGLTLFTGPDAAPWQRVAAAAGGAPVTVHGLDVLTARALGIHGAGALLVRPDGVAVAAWPDAASAAPALAPGGLAADARAAA